MIRGFLKHCILPSTPRATDAETRILVGGQKRRLICCIGNTRIRPGRRKQNIGSRSNLLSDRTGTAEQHEFTNHLINETSPYLRQHAHNPVDWYPWGEEAFAISREQNKPVLLSIGYSACHWCHVMAHESFEDEEIARLMNDNFVNIKVDREERPDLDQIYMNAVQMMTHHGGWPMTVFLTPDAVPFYGGTYFPPQDRYNMPGFPRVLISVAEAYRDRRDDINA